MIPAALKESLVPMFPVGSIDGQHIPIVRQECIQLELHWGPKAGTIAHGKVQLDEQLEVRLSRSDFGLGMTRWFQN